jgi:importin-5
MDQMCIQAAGLAPEDPTGGYMLQAGARLCKCLGEEFLPYLSVVMPPLLHSAQLRPDVNISRADADSDGDDNEEEDDEVMPYLVSEVFKVCRTKLWF